MRVRNNRPVREAICRRGGILFWLLLCCSGWLGLAPAARAQDTGPRVAYSKSPVFRIPFDRDTEHRWKQIQLYDSKDQGRTWHPRAVVAPEDGSFLVTIADGDGTYWFTTRTVDFDNRAYPMRLEDAVPQLKVIVDSRPPVVTLRGLPPRDGLSAIQWDIRDDHLDVRSPGAFALDYRVQGSSEWIPLRVDPAVSGQHAFRPAGTSTLEARLRVRDLAQNESETFATVLPPQDARPSQNPYNAEPVRQVNTPARTNVRLVNSTQFSLNYDLKEVGRSGVSVVELWHTQDGRSWHKYNEKTDPKQPYVYEVEVKGEGLYGLSLVVRSGVGLGAEPPHPGDPPQLWVEVDLTKPVVQLRTPEVGRGNDTGKMFLSWNAYDKNLGPQAVTLEYAERADVGEGGWRQIVANQSASGRYTWDMPHDVPYQMVIRAKAVDRAGNVGFDQTPKAINVDLAIPKSVILDITPARK
jgi:hypothetical protein